MVEFNGGPIGRQQQRCLEMAKLNMDEVSWAKFAGALAAKARNENVPLSGTFEITSRCNLACVHCYVRQLETDDAVRQQELTTAGILHLIDDMAAAGCLTLLLTGGEPIVRPDFLSLYDHAIRSGLLVTIFTNGTTMTPKIAEHIAYTPPYSIEITLYGRTRQTYERITQVPGSVRSLHERY